MELHRGRLLTDEEVLVLVVVRHEFLLLHTKLHREGFPQSKEQGVHVDIGILPEAVGFGVVLEVEVIPPAGWGSLEVADDELVHPVVPPGLAED